jgi:hypothetical protein
MMKHTVVSSSVRLKWAEEEEEEEEEERRCRRKTLEGGVCITASGQARETEQRNGSTAKSGFVPSTE